MCLQNNLNRSLDHGIWMYKYIWSGVSVLVWQYWYSWHDDCYKVVTLSTRSQSVLSVASHSIAQPANPGTALLRSLPYKKSNILRLCAGCASNQQSHFYAGNKENSYLRITITTQITTGTFYKIILLLK